MVRLLMFRIAPLFLRPAAVLLERAIIADGYLLVIVLPISMAALAISGIPVHLDYFRSHPGKTGHERLARVYVSALTWLTMGSLPVLILVCLVPPLELGLPAALAIAFTFVSEKFADESSRNLEFRRLFGSWLLTQILRSSWLFIPIVAAHLGANYLASFVITAACAAPIQIVVFNRVTRLHPIASGSGLLHILDNLAYLPGGLLPAMVQHFPRILIARLYPQYAHVYLATAQLCQGVGLVYFVRFQVPYRKLIARRTRMFYRLLRPTVLRILIPVEIMAVAYLAWSLLFEVPTTEQSVALVLMPLLCAEALSRAIVVAHLGYVPWFVERRSALVTFLICFCAGAAAYGFLAGTGLLWRIGIFTFAVIPIQIAMVFFLVLVARHFRFPRLS